MKQQITTLFALLFLVPCALLADPAMIIVDAPYVKATASGQTDSRAFMTLINPNDHGHTFIGASSPQAEAVALHTHQLEDGVMQMRPLAELELPAGESV